MGSEYTCQRRVGKPKAPHTAPIKLLSDIRSPDPTAIGSRSSTQLAALEARTRVMQAPRRFFHSKSCRTHALASRTVSRRASCVERLTARAKPDGRQVDAGSGLLQIRAGGRRQCDASRHARCILELGGGTVKAVHALCVTCRGRLTKGPSDASERICCSWPVGILVECSSGHDEVTPGVRESAAERRERTGLLLDALILPEDGRGSDDAVRSGAERLGASG